MDQATNVETIIGFFAGMFMLIYGFNKLSKCVIRNKVALALRSPEKIKGRFIGWKTLWMRDRAITLTVWSIFWQPVYIQEEGHSSFIMD